MLADLAGRDLVDLVAVLVEADGAAAAAFLDLSPAPSSLGFATGPPPRCSYGVTGTETHASEHTVRGREVIRTPAVTNRVTTVRDPVASTVREVAAADLSRRPATVGRREPVNRETCRNCRDQSTAARHRERCRARQLQPERLKVGRGCGAVVSSDPVLFAL